MKLITRTLLALLLITPLFAHADEASKKAKVEELMQLTNMNQLMTQMLGQMSERMKASAAEQSANLKLTPAQQTVYDDYQQRIGNLITGSVNWDKMKPIMVQVYDETYTEEELDGILSFYRSPAGKAMVAKAPQLMSKSMALMVQQMRTLQPQIEQLTKDFAEQMQKSGPPPGTPTK
ncbi:MULTISPECIES: DUF2059 domain-containing protein [Acidobacteriaceae]|uniref:DUF2059 domain-containing protein n=1 Tax=Acidobacteriaceae TaxID=204434 RepID=UPI00131DCE33|nr:MULTISPECIES: DUF2059 domain-containing protein [Acidobacteriaceae]MDW5264750.1 DUF2059 domain-containing protein [Edaphobacter sp.]